jgi:hypothetical protein
MNTDLVDDATVGGELPFDFEAWVGLSARLLGLEPEQRLDALGQLGIEVDDWMRCDQHHCASLAADVTRGHMDRAETYGRACAAELERRKHEPTPRDAQEPEPREASATPGASPPIAAPLVEVASFQKETASPPPPAPSRHAASPATTLDVADLPSFIRQQSGALPFSGAISSPLATRGAAPREPSPGAGETLGLGVDLMAQVRATLPFTPRSAGPAFPRLPLQSYASLCAELTVYPERAAEILGKHGIKDDQARRALDADWRARLAEHADTREAWRGMCAQYEGWFRQQAK